MANNDNSNMDAPVTHRELREILADYPTKQDLRVQLGLVVDALSDRMDKQAAALRVEWRTELRAFAEDIKTDIKTDIKQFVSTEIGNVRDHIEQHVSTEIAAQTSASNDEHLAEISVIDEQYKDLPPRVTRLEQKVFPPKRQRRR